MNQLPTITIITVVKNAKDHLKATIDSIVSQSYEYVEYIVIDGCSSDGTVEVIKDYSDQISYWISERDNGLYDAMNKGLDRATGEYVIFMNAGDKLANSDTLEKVTSSILSSNTKVDFAYGDTIEFDDKGNTYYKHSRSHKYIWYGMFANHQAMLFARKSIGELRYNQDFFISGDYAFVSQLFSSNHSLSVVKLEFPVCYFLQGGISSSERFADISSKEQIQIKSQIIGLSSIMIFAISLVHKAMNSTRIFLPSFYYSFRYKPEVLKHKK